MFRRLLTAGLAVALALPAPAFAARPLLDYHRLDAYFALYARDASVPWKGATVRLDTYTSAPVQFAVYQTDVANVISAGANTRPRAIDTHKLRPIARWSYTPPGGYRFQSNDVNVPLGSREGFFVVEARRGNVGEQVWIDRTRVGLISKETPNGILVYGADLGSGKALPGMRVSFIANGRFVDRTTDRSGVVRWSGSPRPVFALAQWANSTAFLSFLPQAPLPRTIVGVKTDSAVAHAGGSVHVVGFARSRSGNRLRASSGSATIVLRSNQGVAAQTNVRLDGAGAFNATLHVPENSQSGDYTVLALVNGAAAATAMHVDANAGGLALSTSVRCAGACDPGADVPLVVHATRAGVAAAGVTVSASIVRSPHVYLQDTADEPWGIAPWSSASVTTGIDGNATIAIPHPNDGLASTYGVRLASGGATEDTRIVVPTSRVTVRVALARTDIGSGTPAAFDVYANEVTGGAPAHGTVKVQLIHGSSVQEQTLTLDDRGHARGSFTSPQTGSNLVVAKYDAEDATDAAQIQVEPQTMETSSSGNGHLSISLDRSRYDAGDTAHVEASLPGASGDALITIESANGTDFRVVSANGGHASAQMRVGNASGTVSAGAAFVRDGALQWDTAPLLLDAPGRPLTAPVTLDRGAYGPGALATATIGGVRAGAGTLIVRVTKGAPTGSAQFTNAPDLLAIGTTATQDTAVEGASWHPWVDSTGEHPAMQSFARRSEPPPDMTMTQADTQSVYWHVEHQNGDSIQLQAPLTPGKYVLSLLKIGDDGRVTAASTDLVVQ
ncbi:MAG TPA: hypothetical protein VFL13_11130 [Candidatus Baltobacteraceae bacterium]|nr:hypothetical protein [Candidatus Baltobacteraceae bacterium]